MASLPELTREQLDILKTCPPPTSSSVEQNQKGQLTRITAAAGSGKTTTLLALAVQAAKLGHGHLTYVTFTNAAANDGKERLHSTLAAESSRGRAPPNVNIDARTLHSCAHQLLQKHQERMRWEEVGDPGAASPPQEMPNKLWSEKSIKRWIGQQCSAQIEDFLRPCFYEIATRVTRNNKSGRQRLQNRQYRENMENTAREQVEFFIYKSLVHFCQSDWTIEKYSSTIDPPFGRDYYPAKLFHKEQNKGEEFGFPKRIYDNQRMVGFYAEQASRLWKMIVEQDIRSFDFEMKRVQLLNLRVPGSILLVDESQDMDACQIDFIARQQVEFGTHVFIVGDAVQSIYGFRGARPGFLLKLRGDIDCMLTESWRFGSAISSMANFILYAKEYSAQTACTYDGKPKNWIPYRTIPGVPDLPSRVTTVPLIAEWRSMKVTIIARANARLLLEALTVLGFEFKGDEDEEEEEDGNGDEDPGDCRANKSLSSSHVISQEEDDDYDDFGGFEQESAVPDESDDLSAFLPENLPKIHINGRGECSGLKLWKKSLQLVESVYRLYALSKDDSSATVTLDARQFPDFVGKQVSWSVFCDVCEQRELSKYNNVINIVKLCRNQTMEAVNTFKEHVMDRRFSPEEADIILTTCHSAKGQEWENVVVCDDFVEFADFKKAAQKKFPSPPRGSPSKRQRVADRWEFGFPGWGDDVNLAYVACTRAKRVLSIPKCLHAAIDALDAVHDWSRSGENGTNMVALQIPGSKGPLKPEEADDLYQSLVVPLRHELALEDSQRLKAALVEDDTNTESVSADGEDS